MTRTRSFRTLPRVPPVFDGMQLNACATPGCVNFAVHPLGEGRSAGKLRDGYRSVGTVHDPRSPPRLLCTHCGVVARNLSNQGCHEEAARFAAAGAPTSPRCLTDGCENAAFPVADAPERYARFGRTSAGAQRYQCRACRATVSSSDAVTHRLRRRDKTEEVLRLLVNKVPMRRMCEVADIKPSLLYQRISLLAERLERFSAATEAAYLAHAEVSRLRTATDRQDYPLAWGSAVERQSFVLRGIATAETRTGYILAQHVNFDPDENALQRELEARALGDPDLPPPFRRFARLWLPHEADANFTAREATPGGHQPQAADAGTIGLAGRGAFVHEQYSTFAHFLFLRRWFGVAESVHVSLDREPSIARACLLAAPERVRDGSMDAFYVRMEKGLSVAKRKLALSRAEYRLAQMRESAPDRSDAEHVRQAIADQYAVVRELQANPANRWVRHPYPSMQEPEREVVCLTDDGRRDVDTIVRGLSHASLRSVDRYFMQVRRKISVLERPVRTSSAGWRVWHGYNAYSPRVVVEALAIFRVVYNFHLAGADRRSPAQRLGLVARRLTLAELLHGTTA